MAFPWSAVIDAGANILGNILGFGSNQSANTTNLKIARETNAMNQAINDSNIKFQEVENEVTRQREDNAVRRRALDMVGAGLSKTLAAGSPASANALQAPQADLPMEGTRVNPFKPDINTNFETAMNHQKQNEIADKEAEAALINARTQEARAKSEAEHWENQDEETQRHNQAVEDENVRFHDIEDSWKKAELDQNSRFHDDAMKISSANLELDKLSYLDKHAQMEIQNLYYEAQTEFQRTTTAEMSARLTADLAESSARVGLYLQEADLTKWQIKEARANIHEISERIAYIVAERYHLNAQTKQTLVNTLSSMYNLLLTKKEGTTTSGTVTSESVAAQNKANRHTELAGRIISGVASIGAVGVGAFLGSGGGRKLLKKMFGDDSKLDPSDFVR